jgi:hypothetical protein
LQAEDAQGGGLAGGPGPPGRGPEEAARRRRGLDAGPGRGGALDGRSVSVTTGPDHHTSTASEADLRTEMRRRRKVEGTRVEGKPPPRPSARRGRFIKAEQTRPRRDPPDPAARSAAPARRRAPRCRATTRCTPEPGARAEGEARRARWLRGGESASRASDRTVTRRRQACPRRPPPAEPRWSSLPTRQTRIRRICNVDAGTARQGSRRPAERDAEEAPARESLP